MKKFKNFNRYEAFNEEIFDTFNEFFRNYRRWKFEIESNGIADLGELTNKIYGIYDGFLYNDLLELAKKFEVPTYEYLLLEAVVDYIEGWIERKGELDENEVHAINLGLI